MRERQVTVQGRGNYKHSAELVPGNHTLGWCAPWHNLPTCLTLTEGPRALDMTKAREGGVLSGSDVAVMEETDPVDPVDVETAFASGPQSAA